MVKHFQPQYLRYHKEAVLSDIRVLMESKHVCGFLGTVPSQLYFESSHANQTVDLKGNTDNSTWYIVQECFPAAPDLQCWIKQHWDGRQVASLEAEISAT